MNAPPSPGQNPQPHEESDELLDFMQIRSWAGFGWGSLRRHRILAIAVFCVMVCASIFALWALPKSWHTETRILAQRNQVMAALGNPGRAIPNDADAPTRAASETVLRRDNLIALIKQTNLVEQWGKSRAPAGQVMDWVRRVIHGAPTEEEKLDALVGMLEKRLWVNTGEGTVTLGLDWPDRQMSFRLVDAAQQNFIEARHALEVSTIAEAISILEWHSTGVRDNIAATMEDLRKAKEGGPRKEEPGTAGTPRPQPAASQRTAAEQETAQLEVMLAAKARAINDLEEYRAKRLSELQGQLAENPQNLGPSHPALANIIQSIAALQHDSPQLEALRKEEKSLREELAARMARRQAMDKAAPASPQIVLHEVRRETAVREDDPGLEYLRNQLRIETAKYEDLMGRIDSARIELDTARAAFKYRYSVIQPAQLPKAPTSPKPMMLLGGGVASGLFLAILFAIAADVHTGKIVEAWQIERSLKLPLLGEVRLP